MDAAPSHAAASLQSHRLPRENPVPVPARHSEVPYASKLDVAEGPHQTDARDTSARLKHAASAKLSDRMLGSPGHEA